MAAAEQVYGFYIPTVTLMGIGAHKELGNRIKTLGASNALIIKLITLDFMQLVLLANIIAWPVAWYFMNRWLQDFPARINLSIWIFIVSAMLAVIIALLATFYQAWRAASANPAVSLKYE